MGQSMLVVPERKCSEHMVGWIIQPFENCGISDFAEKFGVYDWDEYVQVFGDIHQLD